MKRFLVTTLVVFMGLNGFCPILGHAGTIEDSDLLMVNNQSADEVECCETRKNEKSPLLAKLAPPKVLIAMKSIRFSKDHFSLPYGSQLLDRPVLLKQSSLHLIASTIKRE